eukprot:UN03837
MNKTKEKKRKKNDYLFTRSRFLIYIQLIIMVNLYTIIKQDLKYTHNSMYLNLNMFINNKIRFIYQEVLMHPFILLSHRYLEMLILNLFIQMLRLLNPIFMLHNR